VYYTCSMTGNFVICTDYPQLLPWLFHLGISCTAFVLTCSVFVLTCFVMYGLVYVRVL